MFSYVLSCFSLYLFPIQSTLDIVQTITFCHHLRDTGYRMLHSTIVPINRTEQHPQQVSVAHWTNAVHVDYVHDILVFRTDCDGSGCAGLQIHRVPRVSEVQPVLRKPQTIWKYHIDNKLVWLSVFFMYEGRWFFYNLILILVLVHSGISFLIIPFSNLLLVQSYFQFSALNFHKWFHHIKSNKHGRIENLKILSKLIIKSIACLMQHYYQIT